ncbi:multi-Cu oxidase [Methylibium petroleiphilum PM1]|uniref:Multi-Cu oxidase n=2 Tax=Methylibium TaxID=316612 RepID=A2SGA5_METPP|nr:multi-Cu oxidase [Methylibium petroleiphilum PM1]
MVHSICIPVPAVHGRWRTPSAMRSALLAASLLATLTVQAQPAAKAARPDPLDPKASVPALSYVSSFSQYRLLGEEKPVSWRDANDTVTRIGGWRVYAREAQQPDPAPASPAASAAVPTDKAKPMPAGHGGHKMP